MGAIDTKTFKSGNSAAVRLPKELGFEIGAAVRIEKVGRSIKITAIDNAEEGKRSVARLIAALEAIGPVGEIGERLPIEIPERRGL